MKAPTLELPHQNTSQIDSNAHFLVGEIAISYERLSIRRFLNFDLM